MAPNGEVLAKPFSSSGFLMPPPQSLQRATSDLSFAMSKEEILDGGGATATLPPISEVEDARCECCGMSEECTPGYIRRVREGFSGRLICGLCSEAVKEEVEKNGPGRKLEEALDAHMSACARFSKFGRTHPVLYQAEAMRDILRRRRSSTEAPRAKSNCPRDHRGGIARSSSCIPAITKEIHQERTAEKY